ncbi:MAG: sulfurtransferase [Brachybacterium sp.]|nr:sulfurtransferase [Brachybacterium sp.]
MPSTTAQLPPVIDVGELESLQVEYDDALRIVDIRWALDGSKGVQDHLAGHVPGAVYVDLETALAAAGSPTAGRHPLPDPLKFARAMRHAGIGDDTVTVAYDDTDGSQASRLVWLLRATGMRAALLDGGLTAWTARHGVEQLASGPVSVRPAEFTARPWMSDAIAGIDEVDPERASILDARVHERFTGETEPIDPRAGHIPGAVNVPFTENVDEDGQFLSKKKLRKRFQAAGLERSDDIIVYCGSGITATHSLLALERAGFSRARLFPGSWSQWSSDRRRRVATGD